MPSISAKRTRLALAVTLVAGGIAFAQAGSGQAGLSGYLTPGEFDVTHVLEPAPQKGDPRYDTDRRIFRETRKLVGTPRYELATSDADYGAPALMRDFSCAVGVELTPQNAPKTAALVARVGVDVSRATNLPKDIYKRPRPYLVDEGPICVEKSDALAKSPDYPSGHNAWGWTIGLLMAEAAPDRATEVLSRARAFGEGRLVCGVHNLSSVEAGRLNGSIVVAALHGQEAFRKDFEAVRKEVAAARKAGPAPDPAACAKEAEIVAKSPY